jgi:putative ABC transport system permease protein
MTLLPLAARSLWNRRTTAGLTVLSIAISVALLLSVRQLSEQARTAFASTISGTDLIVGARSGDINLLLYSVFHLGNATNNVSWSLYERLARHRQVAWAVPLALGDSHRGYRVLGTNDSYYQHYRFGNDRQIKFTAGQAPADLYETVLGAEVARALGYELGQQIVIAHGAGNTSFAKHADKPFTVAGILAPTGTPIDRTVHVSLEAIQAIHLDWQSGTLAPKGQRVSAEDARRHDLTPQSVTAILIGLRSKVATFQLQRSINEYRGEPLLAILPGVTLQNLWSIVGNVEVALLAVGLLVTAAGLVCLLVAILASLNERRREMAILRSVGARPVHIFTLLISEAVGVAGLGMLAGVLCTYAALAVARPIVQHAYGLMLQWPAWSLTDLTILCGFLLAATLAGVIPAWQAYRRSLADGLTIRL